jgi:hypothetical protein
MRVTASAVFILVLTTHLSTSSPILDQSFEPATLSRFLGIGPGTSGAQTFTVGITGILTEVDVLVERNGGAGLRFDIRPTVNGVPVENDAMTLASITVPASTVPFPASFLDFDVSSFGILISQGEILAMVLSDNSRWFGTPNDPYPGGAAYFRFADTTFTPVFDNLDVGFKTFVEPIPEPSTLALLGIGVIGLGFLRSRRAGRPPLSDLSSTFFCRCLFRASPGGGGNFPPWFR